MIRKTYTPYRSSKRSSKSRSKKNLNLFGKKVFLLIEKGFCPAQISKILNVSKSNLSYYLRHLKASGAIEKIGYGVWKAHNFNQKEVQKRATCNPKPFITAHPYKKRESFKKEVRGHAYRWWVRLPRLEHWSERRKWMQKNGVKFKVIPFGESIELRGHRVKVFRRAIEIYFKADWSLFGENADVCFKYALLEFRSTLTAFKNLFNIDFGRKIEFKLLREHNSLIRNALAKEYISKGEKLQVFGDDGKLWLLIDNSHHLEECETIRERSDNRKVQDFFNGVKRTGITPEFILESFGMFIKERQNTQEDMREYAINIKTHISAIKELSEGVKELKNEVKKFSKIHRGD